MTKTDEELDKYVADKVYKQLKKDILKTWKENTDDDFEWCEYGKEQIVKKLEEIYGDDYEIFGYYFDNYDAQQAADTYWKAFGWLGGSILRTCFLFEFNDICYFITVAKGLRYDRQR